MTTQTRLRLGVVVLLAFCSGHLLAQKVGTSSLQFLKVMPTARATAMGDAYAALVTGADATFWNPAGLTASPNPEVVTTMTLWLFDTKQIALAYLLPLGDVGSFGFQIQYIDYGVMEETRGDQSDLIVPPDGAPYYNPGLTGRTFSPYSYVLGLSYARAFTDKFSAGLTVKYAMESLWLDQAVTVVNPVTGEQSTYKTYADLFLYDFGMRYNTGFRSVVIGVSVQNFGPQVQFANKPRPAPLAFRMGVAGNLFGQEGLFFQSDEQRFTLSYDLFQPNDYRQQMHLGAEYSFAELVALRAGYKFDYDSEGLTFGGGLRFDLSGTPLTFDYSYGKMSEYLNTVHRISLGVQFR